MYTIDFDPKLEKTLKKWKKSNPILFKKLTKILLAIQQDPRHGIGHPEPLVKGSDITYSRRMFPKCPKCGSILTRKASFI